MLFRRTFAPVATMAFAVLCTSTAFATDLGGPTIKDACTALDLRTCTIQTLSLDDLDHGDRGLEVVVDGAARVLDFWQHSNRGPDYRVLVQIADGSFVEHAPSPVNTYRGTDLLQPLTRAAMSVESDGFRVHVRDEDGRQWYAEPLAGRVDGARPGDYAVYFADAIISPQAECPVDETWRINDVDPGAPGQRGGRSGTVLMAEMAVDADYEFYSQYNSVTAVENRVNSVINAVNNQYEGQVGVTHELQAIVVRSANNDPYSTNNIETRLNQLRSDWNSSNHPGIQRDMVHLFTGANTGSTIGLAYLGAVCSSYEYGVVQSNCCGSFGCATDLSAHEMGHNWAAEHCNCSSYTMNPSLTCANQFTSQSINYITSYRDANANCLSSGGPYGACCYGTSCLERSEEECQSTGGAFQGDGTSCASINCTGSTGACCLPSGSCNTLTSAQCDTVGGDYEGDNVPCDNEICLPQPEGACCTDSNCTITEQADCDGSWLGQDTTCAGNPCTATSFAGIEHRIVGVNLVDAGQDNWTVDIYANAGAGERIDAVAGTTSQPKTIASSQGFWQSPYGGPTSTEINPAFYSVVPELRYDSRVTIGAYDSSGDPFDGNALGNVGIDFTNFENGGAISATNGTWYIIPTEAQGGSLSTPTADCENIHGVLIARLTLFGLDSEVTVTALLQGRNEWGNTWQVVADETVALGDFADCNANGTSDVCDIASGDSQDGNDNGVPDECESNCTWDIDADGDTDVNDLLLLIGNWDVLYNVDDLLGLLGEFGCSG